MKLFFQIIIVHTLLNVYVFYKGWKILPYHKGYKIAFSFLFAFELFIYLTGLAFTHYLPSDVFRVIMAASTTWAVLILYMSILLLLFDFVRFLFLKIKRIRNIKIYGINIRRFRQLYYWGAVAVVSIVLVAGYYKFRHPVVNEMNITIEKDTPKIENLRIVMAADLHLGYLNDRKSLKRFVTLIMEQRPDIVLFAGDILDYNMKPVLEQDMEEEFQRLKAPLGVYSSFGNHDHYEDEESKIKWLKERTGIVMLQDSVVLTVDSFYIVGREDRKSSRKPLRKLLEGTDRSLPVIVLNHQPNDLSEEVENNVDLAFYGHTHAGQIFPLNIGAKLLYEVPAGYKKKENTHIFVTSGLGVGGPRYRIGTDSEIMVVNVSFVSPEN